jgi:signal transduction histidine kinase
MSDLMLPEPTVLTRYARMMTVVLLFCTAAMAVITLLLPLAAGSQAIVIILCAAIAGVHVLGFRHAAAGNGSLRSALLYFGVQTALAIGILLAASSSDPYSFLFLVLALQAVLVLPWRVAAAWLALFVLLTSAAALLERGPAGMINILLNSAAFTFTTVFGLLLRQVDAERRRNAQLLGELQTAQAQLRTLAVAEERNRLARDLHDSVKQQAFALSAHLDAAHSLLGRDAAAAERHLGQAEQLADNLRQELAALISDLRPPALGSMPFARALAESARDWAQLQGVQLALEVEGQRPLPPEVEEALFRIMQEALANVARHSQARHVTLHLTYGTGAVALTVADDGCGIAPPGGNGKPVVTGVGLASMRERALALPGGELAIDSAPWQGTKVRVSCRA